MISLKRDYNWKKAPRVGDLRSLSARPAHVRITPDPETPYNRFRSRSAKTDQTGNFSITGLAPGEYRVFASYPASPRSGSLKSDAQLVTLSEHAHKTVQLVMVKPQAE